ncbi:MAG: lysophospholipid acyltransferase family protein [Alicyclobacillaceae bacterium]|nr:lysophospholipid acyltransferase family protein [Alicyclobacillaceae bacterium]
MYAVLKGFVRLVLTMLFRVSVSGAEQIPPRGPVIVAANHPSWLDPFLLGAFLPRKPYFITKAEVFRYRIFNPLIRYVGGFPVQRGVPDVRAVRHSLRLLEDGQVLAIFIEGSRTFKAGLEPKRGVGMLAVKSGAPIVPVAIQGSDRGVFASITIRIGRPIRPSTDDYGDIAQLVMAEIRKLASSA